MFTVMIKIAGDPPTYLNVRGFYRDRLQRTGDGWRVSERVETLLDLHSSESRAPNSDARPVPSKGSEPAKPLRDALKGRIAPDRAADPRTVSQ
jgi:hypothetical protein